MLSYMPELVGFQSMVILDPNGMNFDTVDVFGPAFWLLFKSCSFYYIKLTKEAFPALT